MGRFSQRIKDAEQRKRRKMAEAPTQVIADILSWLPAKNLLRFKSVSKPWYNLISDPWFVDLHRQRSKRFLNLIYMERKEEANSDGQYRTDLTFTCADCEGNISEVFTKALKSCNGFSHSFYCVSSYNDLICVMTWRKRSCEHIYLYNPLSHQVFALPERKRFLDYPQINSTIGFGYVSSTREYKVLRLLFKYKSDTKCEILSFCPRSDGSIDNPCSSSWREITHNLLCKVLYFQLRPAFVRECFYWLTYNPSLRGKIIISFDLRTETFSTILLPSELYNESKSFMKLIVDDFQGKLILVKYQDWLYVSLWVLEDYVKHIWNKTYDIDLRTESNINYFHIYGYMPNGELFILGQDTERDFDSYYFYNAKSLSMRRVPAPIQKTSDFFSGHSFYWESIVTL